MTAVEKEGQKVAKPYALRNFLWDRRLAKVLWAVCGCFWSGAAASIYLPVVTELYHNALAGVLFLVLFPPIVFLYLILGWARQEIDAGRILLRPSPPPVPRSISGFSDPMADANDARSPLYSQRIEELHKRNH